MTLQILFVDDDPLLLAGLRRLLRSYRSDWQAEFCQSGPEALQLLAERPFDAVISDMRMPDMDGATLLSAVRERHPDMIRMMLSGQTEKEDTIRAIGPAHQFLYKPCDVEVLQRAVDRAKAWHDHLANDCVRRLSKGLVLSPTWRDYAERLVAAVMAPDHSLEEVGELISGDARVTDIFLQIVRAMRPSNTLVATDPSQAAELLGLDLLRPVVTAACVASLLATDQNSSASLSTILQHSVPVGLHARTIMELENGDRDLLDQALIAGLLHDVGKVVIATQLPRESLQIEELSEQTELADWEAEQQVMGTTHAAVGAYLLAQAGLPSPIVEAVTFHHQPQLSPLPGLTPLIAIHVADAAIRRRIHGPKHPQAQVNADHLRQLGLDECWPAWLEHATPSRV